MVQDITTSTLNDRLSASTYALLQRAPQTAARPKLSLLYTLSSHGFSPHLVGKAKSHNGLWNTMHSGPCGALISALLAFCFSSSPLVVPIPSVCPCFRGRDAHSRVSWSFFFQSYISLRASLNYFLELATPCLSTSIQMFSSLFAWLIYFSIYVHIDCTPSPLKGRVSFGSLLSAQGSL